MIVTHGMSTHDLAVLRGVDDAAIRKRLQRARVVLGKFLAPCAEHFSGRLQ
jgi:DNA-directed RNA polymerase specialized sigma24 family protein